MNKRIFLYTAIVILIIASLSLLGYAYLQNNNRISKIAPTKTTESATPEAASINITNTRSLDLSVLMEKLNNSTDKSMIIESFKRIKVVSDPLYDIPEYPGGDKNPVTNKFSSVSYGLEGTYKVTDSANVHILIMDDDTDKNGGYIITRGSGAFETSFFKYNNVYMIFEVYESNTDSKKITQDMVKIQEFKQNFFNMYKNIFSY